MSEYSKEREEVVRVLRRTIDGFEIEELGDSHEAKRIWAKEKGNIRRAIELMKAWGII